MNKYIFILAILINSIAFAQEKSELFLLQKGTWQLEGEFSLGSDNQNFSTEIETFTFNFSPKLGYFINDNLVLGLGLGYGYSNSEIQQTGDFLNAVDAKANSYSIFPYIKQYIPIGKRLAIHVQGEVRYMYIDRTSTSINNPEQDPRSETVQRLFIGFRPGLTFQASSKILLQTSVGFLGYSQEKIERSDDIEESRQSFGLDFGTSNLMLGMSFLF